MLLAGALRLGVVRRDYFFVDFLAAGFAAAFAAGLAAALATGFAAAFAAGLATGLAAGFLAAGLTAAAGFATTFFFAAIQSHLPSMPKGHEGKICFWGGTARPVATCTLLLAGARINVCLGGKFS